MIPLHPAAGQVSRELLDCLSYTNVVSMGRAVHLVGRMYSLMRDTLVANGSGAR
jgi:hypothetical protein